MAVVRHFNPETLHSSHAFTQVVRVPAGADMVYVGGQNGVGADGAVVDAGMAEQARQALANLRTCLEAAGAVVADVVKWTIFYVEGADVQAGLSAFGEFWPRDAPPPAITVVKVSDVGPPGALLEIEAVAAVR
jgi:enamine deaminase RidA (YjgF/YER057c/UK114 family)